MIIRTLTLKTLILLLSINLGIQAQPSYQVEKIWNLQFKLPQNSIGKANGKKARYWIETRGQDLHDYELHLYRIKPKQFKQKIEDVLEDVPNDAILPSQKTEIINDKKWTVGKRHHLKMQYIEFQTKYSSILFTFEWNGKGYIGWICARDASKKELLSMTFLSIQPE